MSTAARPIYFPSSAALHWVQQRALGALQAWAAEWLLVGAGHPSQMHGLKILTVTEPIQRRRGGYLQLRGEAGCMWVRCVEADRRHLGKAVVGAELMPQSGDADEWIAQAIACAWEARNHALCTALLGAVVCEDLLSDELPEDLLDVGSGALQLSCAFIGLHAIVDGGVWSAVPAPIRAGAQAPNRLAPLEQAVRSARVSMEALLGSVEIELAQLLDLACGDVVRLPLRLGETVEVRCEGMHLARAALGEMHGYRSVRLIDRNGENT
jgi:flagellar motor switch protein FliM/N